MIDIGTQEGRRQASLTLPIVNLADAEPHNDYLALVEDDDGARWEILFCEDEPESGRVWLTCDHDIIRKQHIRKLWLLGVPQMEASR